MKKRKISLYDANKILKLYIKKSLFCKPYIEYEDIAELASRLLHDYKNVELTMGYNNDKFILKMTVKGFLGGVKEIKVKNVNKQIKKDDFIKKESVIDEGIFHYWMNH